MPTSEKGKRGFQREYNPYKILPVLLKTKEKKTSVIKKELCIRDPGFCMPTNKWYNDALKKLETEGLVKRTEKEMDNAYYWTITEEGIKKVKEEQEK